MRVNFEEKTYENYFNSELASQTEIYFPLGQVQEGILGFDSSAFSVNKIFWQRINDEFNFFSPFSGIDLVEVAEIMENLLQKTLEKIPKIKTNILFQYKKPEYIKIPLGKEWNFWNQKYYRYDIYKEQHALLMKVNSQLEKKVFIVYAAPALHDVNDLVTAYINRQIIEISNFRKASELNGHHRNTYTQAGKYSIAFSEPEKLDSFDIIQTIKSLNFDENSKEKNNKSFVLNFINKINSIILENDYYNSSYNKLNNQYSRIEKYELFYGYLIMKNFKQLTGTQWIITF